MGIQCSLHATTSVSTPKKQNLSHIVFSDSDISGIEADKHHHNQSYVPSSESCLSYAHFNSILLLFHMFALFCKGPMKHTHISILLTVLEICSLQHPYVEANRNKSIM